MYRTLIILLLVIIAFIACKKLGYDPDPNNDLRSGYLQDTLYAVADSVINKGDAYTGLSDRVVIGKRDGFSAGFLINFSFLDTLSKIDTMYMQFTTLNSYGAGLYDNISAQIYSVDSTWGSFANQDARFRNPPIDKMEYVTQGNFTTQDSAISSFTIPLDFNNIWNADKDLITDSLTYNFYFQLGNGNENAMVELGSYLSNQFPVLIYKKTVNDTSVLDTVGAIASVSIFNYDRVNGTALNHSDETLIISSGIVTHSLIKFDFSGLPEDRIYYNATLELTEDAMNEYENRDNNSAISFQAVENLADTLYNPSNEFFDMTSSDGLTVTNSLNAQYTAEDFIQPLLNGQISNEWFEVQFSGETNVVSVKKYWGIKYPDKNMRPRLIINYLNPKK